jgi:endonuclease/exonuclease/phosphatase (EEP) superfamily protein YafD
VVAEDSLDNARVAEHSFRAMTFNTGNDFIAPQDLIALLVSSGAAVAALEEVSERNAEALLAMPDDVLPYRWAHGEHINGKALVSIFPMVEVESMTLTSGRPYVRAVLDMWGTTVTIFVAHLPPGDYRKMQLINPAALADLDDVLARVDITHPCLLLGDFNVITRSRVYRRIRAAGFVDTFAATGRRGGFTYPRRHMKARVPLPPAIRIDYIWASPHFTTLDSNVWPGLGSDHRPVISDLHLLESGR